MSLKKYMAKKLKLRYMTAPNRIVSDVENYSSRLANADSLSIYAQGKQITVQDIDERGLVGALQDSPIKSDAPAQRIEFIPMGAAHLCISIFLIIGDGDATMAWHEDGR